MANVKTKTKAKTNSIVKDIILGVVTLVLIVAMILANHYIKLWETNIILFFTNGGFSDEDSEERDNAIKMGAELVEDVVGDSIVMLKNENDTLPLQKGTKINFFGWNSTDKGFLLTGGGSGGSTPVDELAVTLLDAFDDAKVEYNKDLVAAYEAFNNSYDADAAGSWGGQGAEAQLLNPGASFYTDELMNSAREFSDTAVIVISRYQKENGMPFWTTIQQSKYDGSHYGSDAERSRTYLQTSVEEDAMIAKVTEKFDKVIVLLNLCNVMECGFIDNAGIDAALYVGAPGQSGTKAIPKVMFGELNPSGRTADTYAYYTKDAPSFANAVYATNPRGWRSGVRAEDQAIINAHDNNIHYQEGIYVGYRYYETAFAEKVKFTVNDREQDFSTEEGYKKIVQYPFGYGLSYPGTQFKWEILEAPEAGTPIDEESKFEIKVRVTNTGTVEGKDVVQLYYTPPYYKNGIEKSAMNLLAFAKTVSLKPANLAENKAAESQVITFNFTGYDLASYDCYDANDNGFESYELDIGDYEIKLMKNSHEAAEIDGGSTVTLNVPGKNADDAVIFILDPDTEELVENRFTGESAYAGMPIDGSTVHDGGVKYMSRADFDETFPRVRHAAPTNKSAVSKASQFSYSDMTGVKDVNYNQNNGLYLVTRADGSKASGDDLNGRTDAELKYNAELMKKLAENYDAPEWDLLLSQLSKDETVGLIANGGWGIWANVSLGLPRQNDQDGPSGFSSIFDNSGKTKSLSFPTESTMACSWNVQNAYNVGRVQAMVADIRGFNGWYAPGVNIHRSPYGARNFEAYSEDPILSGELASEVIRGAKHNGMRCYLKHFAMDDNGDNPWDQNVWATEQSAREIYFKPFEIAVKSGANAVMSSFNRIGANWSGGNRALLTDILTTEWGFKGVIITDACNGYMDRDKGVRAGNDLWLGKGDAKEMNINDKLTAFNAREAVKGIVYNYCDTYTAAKLFAENGDPNDPYKVNVDKVSVAEKPSSPLFSFLWVFVNILLAVGMALCIFFIIFPKFRKKKAVEAIAAGGESSTDGCTDGAAEDIAETDDTAAVFPETAEAEDTAEDVSETDETQRSDAADATEAAETEVVTEDRANAEEPKLTVISEDAASVPKHETTTDGSDELKTQNTELCKELESLKEQNALLRTELETFTALTDELNAERSKRRELEARRKAEQEKRKAENKNKPKTPSTKQQVTELKAEVEELRKLLDSLKS